MTKVDSEGRIVLPQNVRQRLGLTPGSEVEVREEDGRVVVEPVENPEEILEDLARIIEAATADTDQTSRHDHNTQARDHIETIRRQANETRPTKSRR